MKQRDHRPSDAISARIWALCFTGALCFLPLEPVAADSPGNPEPQVISSPHGRFFFKMIPGSSWRWEKDEQVRDREPFGVCYKVGKHGEFEEQWRTDGWHAYPINLTDDGVHLVCTGGWSIGHRPDKEDLGIAFYKNGKLLKRYSTADLVADPTAVQTSTSHYEWLAANKYTLADDGTFKYEASPDSKLRLDQHLIFHLKTIDCIKYQFDITTGKIKAKTAPAAAEPPPARFGTPRASLEAFKKAAKAGKQEEAWKHFARYPEASEIERKNMRDQAEKRVNYIHKHGWDFEILQEKSVAECALFIVKESKKNGIPEFDTPRIFMLRQNGKWKILPYLSVSFYAETYARPSIPILESLDQWYDAQTEQATGKGTKEPPDTAPRTPPHPSRLD